MFPRLSEAKIKGEIFVGPQINTTLKSKTLEEKMNETENMGYRMSVKLHFLCSHLDFFQENLGHFSEDHGERFHQDIEPMEKRYKGRWDSAMMGDYIRSLIRQDKSGHKRKTRSTVHF